MPRTITDEEWNFLQQKRQVADLVEPIIEDPLLSDRAKALLKEKYPQMRIADYDIEQRMNGKIQQLKEEQEQREAARRNDEEHQKFQSIRKKTQDEFGFTNEAMEELEKMMVERNIGDYEVAASYMASKQPKTSDTNFSDGRWNHDKAPGYQEIAKDPEGWGRGELLKTLYAMQDKEKGQRF